MNLYQIETYRGTATGWLLAGSNNNHTQPRAEHLLALHRRIDPDRFIYRLTTTTQGVN